MWSAHVQKDSFDCKVFEPGGYHHGVGIWWCAFIYAFPWDCTNLACFLFGRRESPSRNVCTHLLLCGCGSSRRGSYLWMGSFWESSCIPIVVGLSLKLPFLNGVVMTSCSSVADFMGLEELDIVVEVINCWKQWYLEDSTWYQCGFVQTAPNVLALASSSRNLVGRVDSKALVCFQQWERRRTKEYEALLVIEFVCCRLCCAPRRRLGLLWWSYALATCKRNAPSLWGHPLWFVLESI